MKNNRSIIKGHFEFKNGKLDFNCTNENATFSEVRQALLKIKSEIDRQLENEKKCPYYGIN